MVSLAYCKEPPTSPGSILTEKVVTLWQWIVLLGIWKHEFNPAPDLCPLQHKVNPDVNADLTIQTGESKAARFDIRHITPLFAIGFRNWLTFNCASQMVCLARTNL